ncbi:MAG: nucleotidyltransferase domain-containing protein [Acidimicrobiia bacterium]|nr:nucleotidyltransferase domain-containing protein [Acidimicrobiia bacterium]
MRDPLEGVSAAGTITTGADIARVPAPFAPVLDAAADALADPAVALYLYGSVATGQARPRDSDVDLLTVDLGPNDAAAIATELTAQFPDTCRAVEIAAATGADFLGDTDAAYGGRVFLRHYCVRLRGLDHDRSTHDFPADARAARGFNGDLAAHAQRWQTAIDDAVDSGTIGRLMARKTLLAVAGLVSLHDRTWTTDRLLAATRWAEIEPDLAPGLAVLLDWTRLAASPQHAEVVDTLERTVMTIVGQFADRIGLWNDAPDG